MYSKPQNSCMTRCFIGLEIPTYLLVSKWEFRSWHKHSGEWEFTEGDIWCLLIQLWAEDCCSAQYWTFFFRILARSAKGEGHGGRGSDGQWSADRGASCWEPSEGGQKRCSMTEESTRGRAEEELICRRKLLRGLGESALSCSEQLADSTSSGRPVIWQCSDM